MRKIILLLITVVLFLIAIGIIMLASASVARAESLDKTPLHFVWRQLQWLALSVVAAAVATRLDYHIYARLAIAEAVGIQDEGAGAVMSDSARSGNGS